MEAKARLIHEDFGTREERDARHHELQQTHENVCRYTDQEHLAELGTEWWEMRYYVAYTPLIQMAQVHVVDEEPVIA